MATIRNRKLTLMVLLLSRRTNPESLARSCSAGVMVLFTVFCSFGTTPLLRSSIYWLINNITGQEDEIQSVDKHICLISVTAHLCCFMGHYGGYSVLSQKLFAVVVPEAFGPKMLRAQAGVCSRNKVFHAQVLHPFGSKLRFAEWEPEKHEGRRQF